MQIAKKNNNKAGKIDSASRLPGDRSLHGRSVAYSSYPVIAGTMRPRALWDARSVGSNKAIFASRIGYKGTDLFFFFQILLKRQVA